MRSPILFKSTSAEKNQCHQDRVEALLVAETACLSLNLRRAPDSAYYGVAVPFQLVEFSQLYTPIRNRADIQRRIDF